MKKHLPTGDWPEADRRLFEVSFQGADDPFRDDAAPGQGRVFSAPDSAHIALRLCTVAFLACGRKSPSALSDDPQHRMTPERIKSYSLALGNIMKPSSVATYVAWLLSASYGA